MKNLNWGTKLAIVFGIFILTVVYRIYVSYQRGVDLISATYYPEGVDYQHQIEKKQNTHLLSEKVKVSQTAKNIEVVFPSFLKGKTVEGTILFYCASSTEKDQSFTISLTDSLKQIFDKQGFTEKRYTVKIDWKTEGKSYYQEENVVVE